MFVSAIIAAGGRGQRFGAAEPKQLLKVGGRPVLERSVSAFLAHPTHANEWAHELEDVGTMHVLNACAGVEPRRFVMISTTLVYGAHPKNPNFLTEDAELRGHRDSRFVNDKVRAEHQVQRFAAEHSNVQVCILRFAPILGPTVSNMYTRFFRRPVAPVMMGHDPLMQFVHEQDAAYALLRAVESRATTSCPCSSPPRSAATC